MTLSRMPHRKPDSEMSDPFTALAGIMLLAIAIGGVLLMHDVDDEEDVP